MKKIITLCLILLGSFVTMANAIVVEIPDPSGTDDFAVVGATQIVADESNFFTTIQMVNKYLWIGIGLVCMIFLVYAGIGLITANGDEKKMKTANKILIGASVGILISIFSFTVVRLLVNLF